MESIIINQKKLASEIFYSFSQLREIKGVTIQPVVTNDLFKWEIPQGKDGSWPLEKITWLINRDQMAFRASPDDIVIKLSEHWAKFYNSISKPGTQTVPGYLHAKELPFSLKDKPVRDDNADHSIDLLIDIDGSNDCFRVGYYVFGVDGDDDEFVLYDKSEQVYPAMKWDYLPVKKT